MIEFFLMVGTLMIVIPITIYYSVKCGTYAFYRARFLHRFDVSHLEDCINGDEESAGKAQRANRVSSQDGGKAAG